MLGKQNVLLLLLREHGHQIGDADLSGGDLERGDEDVRALEVFAPGAERAHGSDPPGAAHGGVQHRGEQRGAVELRPAQPVNRTTTGNKRRRAAVSDDGVVLNPGSVHLHAASVRSS
jgi:hypothetical protein